MLREFYPLMNVQIHYVHNDYHLLRTDETVRT